MEKIITFLPIETIEPQALEQIKNTASVPFLFHHVAVMPDTHYGKGSTVGTVLPTEGAIIPAAVGVDIGCGMIAVETNLVLDDVKDKLHELRIGIERRIPMSAGRFNDKITETAAIRIKQLEELAGDNLARLDKVSPNWREQLGTLGGGNHFIELCITPENKVWATLHSGSRGIGNKLANEHIKIAQDFCKKNFISLVDPDLAYLVIGSPECDQYLKELHWSQQFALLNREEMMDRFLFELKSLAPHLEELKRINCHHNFTQQENHMGKNVWITRKGAIKAGVDDYGMIPGSMGTRSYIVKGKGNAASFHSAPHGAGRKMSRTKARQSFTMDDFDKAMIGIEHRRSDVLLDEVPGAYKDIDLVMENAKDLVEVITTLKQILNVKGD